MSLEAHRRGTPSCKWLPSTCCGRVLASPAILRGEPTQGVQVTSALRLRPGVLGPQRDAAGHEAVRAA